jgi:hypothetical protein
MVFVAFAGPDRHGQSVPFAVEPGAPKNIGRIVIMDGEKQAGRLGKLLPWRDHPLQGGVLLDQTASQLKSALVIYCTVEEAPMILDALDAAHRLLDDVPQLAMVVDGTFAAQSDHVAILRGQAPGPARTYLVGRDGRVVLETVGMPPLRALRESL